MASVQPRCSKEEFARRGDVLYDQHIRPNFEPSHNRQFAAIGIETGEFKVDPDELDAVHRTAAPSATTSSGLKRQSGSR